jgi:hypothetical protein
MKRRSCSIPYACVRFSSRCSKSAIAQSTSVFFRPCFSPSSATITVLSWVSIAKAASLYANDASGGEGCPACGMGGCFFSSRMIAGMSDATITCRVSGGTFARVSTMIPMPMRLPARGFIRTSESAASTRRLVSYLSWKSTALSLSGPCAVDSHRWMSSSLTRHPLAASPDSAMATHSAIAPVVDRGAGATGAAGAADRGSESGPVVTRSTLAMHGPVGVGADGSAQGVLGSKFFLAVRPPTTPATPPPPERSGDLPAGRECA